MFFDFHVHGDCNVAKEALRLGYEGVAIIQSSKKYDPDSIYKNNTSNIFSGVEIYAKNPHDLKRKIKMFREQEDVIIVNGGNLKINRAACEDPRVDILAHPYKSRRDSGMNHIIARKAAENDVAIEFSIGQLIKTRAVLRAKILSYFRDIIKLQHKFGFPIIITSNAYSIYDLRTPEDIIALACCLGMNPKEAEDSLSSIPLNIIDRNKLRKNTVMNGVRIVK